MEFGLLQLRGRNSRKLEVAHPVRVALDRLVRARVIQDLTVALVEGSISLIMAQECSAVAVSVGSRDILLEFVPI